MKSTLSFLKPPKVIAYPCLMKLKTGPLIILAVGASDNGAHINGFVVHSCDFAYPIGKQSVTWIAETFNIYEGGVTLENDE